MKEREGERMHAKWLSNVEEEPELVSKSPRRVRVFILGNRMSSLFLRTD